MVYFTDYLFSAACVQLEQTYFCHNRSDAISAVGIIEQEKFSSRCMQQAVECARHYFLATP